MGPLDVPIHSEGAPVHPAQGAALGTLASILLFRPNGPILPRTVGPNGTVFPFSPKNLATPRSPNSLKALRPATLIGYTIAHVCTGESTLEVASSDRTFRQAFCAGLLANVVFGAALAGTNATGSKRNVTRIASIASGVMAILLLVCLRLWT